MCPILMNVSAGAFKSTPGVEQVRAEAAAIGLGCDVIATSSSDEMLSTIRQVVKERAPRLAIAGGDGTIHQAVQILAHTDTALGIIPQGTFNNFAAALDLPTDLGAALRTLKDGEAREVSLGKIGDRYFTEVAGVGLFADTLAAYGLGTNKSPLKGIYAFLKVFFSMRSRKMRLTIDGQVIRQRAVWCTVANTCRMAQGLPIAPQASVYDDHLDVVVIGNLSRFEFLRYYRAIRNEAHAALPKVAIHRASLVKIETNGRANVHADDTIAGQTPAIIEFQERALKVIVNPRPQSD